MADPAAGEEAGDILMGGCADWRQAAERAEAAGSPLSGLPQGIRFRSSAPKPAAENEGAADSEDAPPSVRKILKQEAAVLGVVSFACVVVLCFVMVFRRAHGAAAQQAAHPSCKQCQPGWWENFWQWRLTGIASRGQGLPIQAPPAGMEWEWDQNASDTDWFGVSPEFVDKVVSTYADPKSGPILHVGCGDSPMPELLYKAGFLEAEHIDIAPQIVTTMQQRYPAASWPGMSFAVRDFLAPMDAGGGPPLPLHRFAAVIDKAGIWDWLQDEASEHLPLLLSMVRNALLDGPQKGLYIIVTKQNPAQFSESLARVRAQFLVETSQPLGSRNIAWSYVLEPL